MTTFQFTPPGGEPLREPPPPIATVTRCCCSRSSPGDHGARAVSGLRSAAVATAIFGGAALLLFLVIDLPDAGKLGDLEDPTFGLANARADPQTGFWLEAVGAVVLGLASVAFATLRPEQLHAPRRGSRRRAGEARERAKSERGRTKPPQATGASPEAPRGGGPEANRDRCGRESEAEGPPPPLPPLGRSGAPLARPGGMTRSGGSWSRTQEAMRP